MNTAPSQQEIVSTVFQLARYGLTEVAKDIKNPPSVIAEAAARLELWRAMTEKQLAEPQPMDVPPRGEP